MIFNGNGDGNGDGYGDGYTTWKFCATSADGDGLIVHTLVQVHRQGEQR